MERLSTRNGHALAPGSMATFARPRCAMGVRKFGLDTGSYSVSNHGLAVTAAFAVKAPVSRASQTAKSSSSCPGKAGRARGGGLGPDLAANLGSGREAALQSCGTSAAHGSERPPRSRS